MHAAVGNIIAEFVLLTAARHTFKGLLKCSVDKIQVQLPLHTHTQSWHSYWEFFE